MRHYTSESQLEVLEFLCFWFAAEAVKELVLRMQGFKVVVTLPEGKKSHFVPNLPNNFAGAKAATDQICSQYYKMGLIISPTANFFDDQRELVPPPKGHLEEIPKNRRCWCGWRKRGECASCPDELSFADNTKANP